MSLVGPRPSTATDVTRLGWAGHDADWRFDIRPGITRLSQLFARRGARHSLRLDRLYLQRQSLSLDMQLLALPLAVNVLGKAPVRRLMRAARRVL